MKQISLTLFLLFSLTTMAQECYKLKNVHAIYLCPCPVNQFVMRNMKTGKKATFGYVAEYWDKRSRAIFEQNIERWKKERSRWWTESNLIFTKKGDTLVGHGFKFLIVDSSWLDQNYRKWE